MEKYNFGPNVIYFALGITEGRPAGAFWADQIVFWAGKASRRGLLERQWAVAVRILGALRNERSFLWLGYKK